MTLIALPPPATLSPRGRTLAVLAALVLALAAWLVTRMYYLPAQLSTTLLLAMTALGVISVLGYALWATFFRPAWLAGWMTPYVLAPPLGLGLLWVEPPRQCACHGELGHLSDLLEFSSLFGLALPLCMGASVLVLYLLSTLLTATPKRTLIGQGATLAGLMGAVVAATLSLAQPDLAHALLLGVLFGVSALVAILVARRFGISLLLLGIVTSVSAVLLASALVHVCLAVWLPLRLALLAL